MQSSLHSVKPGLFPRERNPNFPALSEVSDTEPHSPPSLLWIPFDRRIHLAFYYFSSSLATTERTTILFLTAAFMAHIGTPLPEPMQFTRLFVTTLIGRFVLYCFMWNCTRRCNQRRVDLPLAHHCTYCFPASNGVNATGVSPSSHSQQNISTYLFIYFVLIHPNPLDGTPLSPFFSPLLLSPTA